MVEGPVRWRWKGARAVAFYLGRYVLAVLGHNPHQIIVGRGTVWRGIWAHWTYWRDGAIRL